MTHLSVSASAAATLLAALPVCAENAFEPLPVLTVKNVGYQLQRCSALYAAAQWVFEKALSATEEPRKKAHLQALSSRAKRNGDGLLISAVLSLVAQEHKSNAEAVNIVMSAHDGMIAAYLRSLGEPAAGPSFFAKSPLWVNDTSNCRTLVAHLGPLMPYLEK